MSDNIMKFDFEGFPISVIEMNGKEIWVAAEIARGAGYKNSDDATKKITREWSRFFRRGIHFDVLEGKELSDLKGLLGVTGDSPVSLFARNLTVLYEPGVYALLFRAQTEKAVRMQDWITVDVIPEIRRTGGYSLGPLENVPKDFEEALVLAVEQERERKRLVAKIEEDKPKVQFAEDFKVSKDAITMAKFAASLSAIEGLVIGEIRLFQYLRKRGYLRVTGDARSLPVQRYINAGLFEVETVSYRRKDGSRRLSRKAMITAKGQIAIWNRLMKDFGRVKITEKMIDALEV